MPIPLYQDAVAAEFVFRSTTPRWRFAIVEDQEQVDKLLEIREQCPQLQRIWYDDPRGLRNYSEPGLASLDALIDEGRRFVQANPGSSTPNSSAAARRRGGDVLHLGHHRQPEGRGAHALHAARPRAPAPISTS